MSANFNRYGIAAEQDMQVVLKLVAEMQKVNQVAKLDRPVWNRTSYLVISKLNSLNRLVTRRPSHTATAAR